MSDAPRGPVDAAQPPAAPVTAPRREPSGRRERQPGGLPGAAAPRMGRDDRRAEPLAARVLAGDVAPQALRGDGGLRCCPSPVVLAGPPQRHLYLARCRRAVRAGAPRRGVPGGGALRARRNPVGRRACTAAACPSACSATRTSTAPCPRRCAAALAGAARRRLRGGALADRRGARRALGGARARSRLAPPAVPGWEASPAAPASGPSRSATRGGWSRARVCATCSRRCGALQAPVELLLFGDGELRARARGTGDPRLGGAGARRPPATTAMAGGYAQLDVLVLPSHTTPTWKEQFGRVIIEALWCGVPVVGSDSGEIPWLIGLTGRRARVPRGRRRGACRTGCEQLRDDPGAAARAGAQPGAPRSSACSRSPRRPTRSSGCCSRRRPAAAPAER